MSPPTPASGSPMTGVGDMTGRRPAPRTPEQALSSAPLHFDRTDSLMLGAVRTAPGCARSWAAVVLHGWGLSRLTEDVELVVSELVTNAYNLAEELGMSWQIRVCLLSNAEALRIEVFDPCSELPTVKTPGPDATSGRGLMICEALSDEMGTFYGPRGGKAVYVIIRLLWTLLLQTHRSVAPRIRQIGQCIVVSVNHILSARCSIWMMMSAS